MRGPCRRRRFYFQTHSFRRWQQLNLGFCLFPFDNFIIVIALRIISFGRSSSSQQLLMVLCAQCTAIEPLPLTYLRLFLVCKTFRLSLVLFYFFCSLRNRLFTIVLISIRPIFSLRFLMLSITMSIVNKLGILMLIVISMRDFSA